MVVLRYVRRTYDIESWSSPTDFLEQYGRRIGKLVKGGEPDTNAAAKLVLHDWQRGRLPYFTLPPDFALRSQDAGEGKKLTNSSGRSSSGSSSSSSPIVVVVVVVVAVVAAAAVVVV